MLSRRGFLLGSGAAALVVACGDDGDTPAGDTPADDTPAGLVLGEAFDRNRLLVAGIPQRAPFVLFEESGGLVRPTDAPDAITFTLASDSGETLAPITTQRRGDDIDRAYYPLVTTWPSPGTWSVTADLGDGRTLASSVVLNARSAVPQVGTLLPVAPTPTTAASLGATTICTRNPPCPLHEVSLDTAAAAGRPVAVLISTPAYCQVGICGPVLDLLIEAAAGHTDLEVIHVEVYTEGTAGAAGPVSPLVTDTFGLEYEPALFVADATGMITARLDNIYDGAELTEALATAID